MMTDSIIIGFSRARSKIAILSKIIMFAENTNFSHAYIKVYSKSLDRYLIYQATGSGVYFVGNNRFLSHSLPVEEYKFNISEESKIRLLQWAVDNSGKPYGKLQLLGLAIKRLAMIFGFNIKNPLSDGSKAYICCELVAEAVKDFGPLIEEDLDSIGLVQLRDSIINLYSDR